MLLSLIALIAISITLVSWRRRIAKGAISVLVFALSLFVWAVAYALFWNNFPPSRLFWFGIITLSGTVLSTALLTFVLEFINRKYWLTKRNLALLAVEPVITQLFLWTDSWNLLFLGGKWEDTVGKILSGNSWLLINAKFSENLVLVTFLTGGPWLWINAIYTDSIVLVAFIILIITFIRSPRPNRLQSGIVLAGTFAPILGKIINYLGVNPNPGLDTQYIAFTITGLTLLYVLLHDRPIDSVPIPRDIVVERMNDGWVVLDTKFRIVDLNPVAEKLIGLSRKQLFGQPAEIILSIWPKLSMERIDENATVLDTDGSVKIENEWRYLNLRVHPLKDLDKHHMGHVIIWRDITERRKAEESRQQARDEMFILLHAISSAASRTLDMASFLAESIYQIVYSFQSQASVIYLLDDSDEESETRKLLLVAHHGLSTRNLTSLSSIPEDSEMVKWIFQHREPLLIPDLRTDPRVPAAMQQTDLSPLLIVPLIIENQILGMVGLARKDGPVYRTDEIARLNILADELAALIHTDRKRKLKIASAERQRLVRDLHDSVTQNLYGLVTFTEAAQAGLETGSTDMVARNLSRIGESARQALKEMRLFLYELQPVDLEREGLVAVLHQRLAAVEGRADIKARLLADDNLNLLPDEQVALYFIAQEALNNVLRHAHAKSVTIRLKKRKASILLEIKDDGRGFDLQKMDRGGMGLRNIRERASQVGGKLKTKSVIGEGTKISISVNRKKRSKLNQD